ncbi:MAG: 4'-phosphopantetheinyl transferase superfamily protein [Chloroflexi bacterium]|nr:4'-phosphopantetheinyl transferase superfamily protein [Chloroflexota bacterium]
MPDHAQLWAVHMPYPANGARSSPDRWPDRWTDYLAQDEVARAQRYRCAEDRARFITARLALRGLLARYLGASPQSIDFSYNAFGKPLLPAAPLEFNLAHSGSYAVIAVTQSHHIGIDIECHRDLPDRDDVAAQIFSADERRSYDQLPESARLSAFYRAWTCKEAVVKALGRGLQFPVQSCVVALESDKPARLIRLGEDSVAAQHWRLHEFSVAPGYSGCVAVAGAGDSFRWPGLNWITLVDLFRGLPPSQDGARLEA